MMVDLWQVETTEQLKSRLGHLEHLIRRISSQIKDLEFYRESVLVELEKRETQDFLAALKKTTLGGLAGGTIGGLAGGPIGAAIGGAAGAYTAHKAEQEDDETESMSESWRGAVTGGLMGAADGVTGGILGGHGGMRTQKRATIEISSPRSR
jgi:hypothetical protein